MPSGRATYSSLLFGFGILAIGLIVVRTSDHPWIVAPLFGLTLGGLWQFMWYILDHVTLRWKWKDTTTLGIGGVLALALFKGLGLATPQSPILVGAIILVCFVLAQLLAITDSKPKSKLPQTF